MRENVIQFCPASKAARARRSPGEAPSTTAVVSFPAAKASKVDGATAGVSLAQYEALPWEEKRAIAETIEARIEARLRDRSPACARPGLHAERTARYEAWGKAGAAACFWKALADLDHALLVAQREKMPEALLYEPVEAGSAGWHANIRAYQDATDRQLLTPAPNMGAVNWKQRRKFSHLPRGRIERAIAEDLAWLRKYPASERRVRRPVD
jgi:hypothetical protein